jgi:osmotically-inducible protein OsmY
VLEAFINDPILAERALEIEADDDGDVLLHGSVRNPREVAHAVTLARGVPGVTRVRQRLSVRARRQ